jgi:polyhydroxybutyrate depolymerase
MKTLLFNASRFLTLLFLLAGGTVASAACDWSKSGEVQKCSVNVNGQERTFLLVVPRNFSGPLLLAFHPSRGQGWFMSERWTRKANAEGFAAIYPDAIPNARGVVAWVVDRDLPFVQVLLEQARKNLPILDPHRIYAMGFSNGAWLTEMLGQRMPELAAIADVSAVTGIDDWKTPPMAKPSVIIFHGEMEEIAPVCGHKGRYDELAGRETILQYWRKALDCKPIPTVCKGGQQTSVSKVETQCADSKELRFYKVEGGRHRFPPFPVPPLNEPMTDTIWNFFKSHPKQ